LKLEAHQKIAENGITWDMMQPVGIWKIDCPKVGNSQSFQHSNPAWQTAVLRQHSACHLMLYAACSTTQASAAQRGHIVNHSTYINHPQNFLPASHSTLDLSTTLAALLLLAFLLSAQMN
jgi:hypothetical protein